VKLLLDINVLLDVLLDREPWSEAASQLLSAVESTETQGFVAPHTLPTIYYVMAQSRNRSVAAAAVTDLLRILDVAPLTKADYQEALALPITDFEDAIQAAAASKLGVDYLVTRNEKDFRGAAVPVSDPATVVALLQ
jgi:predicted nucleic acid-binding protein